MKKLIIWGMLSAWLLKAAAQHGVSPAWGAEAALPLPMGASSVRGTLYSNIGVFSSGKRVVFLHRQDGRGGPYYTASHDGTHWSTPRLFAPDTMVIGLHNFKVIRGPDDSLHILWAAKRPRALYYSKMDSALHLVIDSVRIADHPAFNSFDDMYITVDGQGRIHVMWNEGNSKKDTPEAYYSRSLDGGRTWSAKDSLSTHDGMRSSFPRGQFAAYSGDTLAIAWRDSVSTYDWDIQMVVSTDGGATWSTPFTVDANPNYQGDPDVVIDPQGRIHLFFHEAPVGNYYNGIRVVYGYSDDLGATWHPSVHFLQNVVSRNQRSYLVEGSRYDAVRGILWTFWKEEDLPGRRGGDMLAAYSLDRGITWSAPEYVTDRGDTSIGFKAVDLLPNGGIAANYELPNHPSSGLFTVFYKERTPPTLTAVSSSPASGPTVGPNPTRHTIWVQWPGQSIRSLHLSTADGRLLRSFRPAPHSPAAVDFTAYAPGIYWIRIVTDHETAIVQIIKE